jgi:hypothetical protein
MKRYRFITGKDDDEFCKRIENALNEGWHLHGSPSLSFNSTAGHPICGQAVVREEPVERDEPLTL